MKNYLIKMISSSGDNDLGLLILRIVTGILMFYNHGLGKITSGTVRWERLGHALTDLIGIDILHVFFGFMASFAESIGAIMILIGLFTRMSSFLLFFTMMIASLKHIIDGEFSELAFIYAAISLVLMLTGSGKHGADYFINKKFL